jgi:DNA-binding HxlR family transcriptional regulator
MTSAAQPRVCSVARTLEIVGEKWALLAVREVFLGNRRFDEMVRRTGAPRDTLAARLRTLTGAGILDRRQYSEHPARFEYRLTTAGRDLYPVILTLMRWGDRHLAGADGPPLVLEHHCDHRLVPQVVCADCGEPVEGQDVRPQAVPAAQRPPASAAASAAAS